MLAMMKLGASRSAVFVAMAVLACAMRTGPAAASASWSDIDWPTFLSRSDLVWHVMPDRWDRGAFTGNGLLGAMVFVDQGVLSWELGRADVVDNQPSERPMVAAPRLPLGFLRWRGCAASTGQMRLDLWNAEVRGSLGAHATATSFRSWTHAKDDIIGIAVTKGGCAPHFDIEAAPAISDGARLGMIVGGQPIANPAAEALAKGHRSHSVQRLTRGGAHVIAVETFDGGDEWITIVNVSRAGTARAALARADQALNAAKRAGWARLERRHRAHWHAYYPQSFVSLPDAQLESFYWIQMYKLGSASRPDGPIVDTLGPWYHRTPWPGVWWNLNVQLSYWPVYTANRLTSGESLINGLRRGLPQLRANARPRPGIAIGRNSAQDLRSPLHIIDNGNAEHPSDPREQGNLLWALHNLWLHDVHAMNPKLHREVVQMLSEAVDYHASLLERSDDGGLHLPRSLSPEYPNPAADANYDLSLLKWGLTTLLLPQNQALQRASARAKWAALANALPPFPANEDGFMIGRSQPLAVSHRHFSHLLMVYPLNLVSPEEPSQRDVIRRSLDHWIGMEGALEGYSFVVASAISSWLGQGDEALSFLQQLLFRFVRRNTMYMEAGPVIETPLATAQAIHELLLQSRDDAIFVFPALPAAWRDVSFRDLRSPGAMLVSAERHQGRTTQVAVRSLAGQPVRLQLPPGSTLEPVGLPTDRWQRQGPTTFDLRLQRGEVLTFIDGNAPAGGGGPVAHLGQAANPFGGRTQNAWSPAAVAKAAETTVKDRPPAASKHAPTWELLDVSVPTVFTQNGAEEIQWAHTSCEPCGWATRTTTASGQATWKPIKAEDGCFDFRKLLPTASPKDTIAYVRGTFHSEGDGELNLQVGVNDQGRAWWWAGGDRPKTDATVLMNAGSSTLNKNEAQLRLPLRKGLNHLFLKVINEGGGWGTCVRLKSAPPPSAPSP